MKVVFHNVTIVIEAPSPSEAYEELDDMFSLGENSIVSYETDTFSIESAGELHSCEELF